jgi:hypothetical protein
MKKVCQPSPPVRRQRTMKRTPAQESSKLEEKLDVVVTLLRSAAQGVPPAGTLNITPTTSVPEGSVPTSTENPQSSTATNGDSMGDFPLRRPEPNGISLPGSNLTPASSASPNPVPLSSLNLLPALHPSLEPSPEDAESCLNRFRIDFVKHLPFLVIPPSITALQLRQSNPLLWLAIMTVATLDSPRQTSMSKEVRMILVREVFVEGTRNIDLLLAILVYTCW